jgi:cytochrome P450
MDVVGIPQEDHQQLFSWLETFREVMNTEYSATESGDGSLMTEAVEYFRALVTQRRKDPQNDLISKLAAETELSGAEIGSNCFDFILAGQGTMSELLANALFLFDDQNLLAEPAAHDISELLEEVLRYRSPLQARARETIRGVTIGETDIPGEETVILWLGAANRDPDRFERPEAFVPDRDPEHLAFGTGAHSCIGAPLARLQAPIVLETFFESIASVTLDLEAAEPKWKASKLGFERLPVAVTQL